MTNDTKRLMIYAHFDYENKVRAYTEFALQKAREVCQEIVFVSTAALPETELEKVRPYCRIVCLKANKGLDFGMWKHGLLLVHLNEWDELILLNSSVYGPVFPLQEAFDTMIGDACDFWGMTENYEPERHLQSYFIVFRKPVIQSALFTAFWDSVLEYGSKNQIIRSYEVGLSRWLLENGFRMGVYCPWPKLIRYRNAFCKTRSRRFYNPSVKAPVELLKLGVPFVKQEVFRTNPEDVDIHLLTKNMINSGFLADFILDEKQVYTHPIKSDAQLNCPFCGAEGKLIHKRLKDRSMIGGTSFWNIRRCRNHSCGAAWQDPRPREEEIWKAYRTYYTHSESRPYMEWYYPHQYGYLGRVLLRILNKTLRRLQLSAKRYDFYYHGLNNGSPGRLLEIGCGNGGRLLGLQQLGWDIEGHDVDSKAVEYCRTLGLRVQSGSLEDCGFREQSYDVILMSHVIEHLHDPLGVLKRCRELLKPGGKVIISTPNIRSLGRQIYRKHWLPLDPPRHITIFSSKTLRNVLNAAGFGAVRISTITYNMELISLHSRDILRHGFTDANSLPRVKKELVPVFLQLCALILGVIFPWIGEECFAQAENNEHVI